MEVALEVHLPQFVWPFVLEATRRWGLGLLCVIAHPAIVALENRIDRAVVRAFHAIG